MKNDGILNYVLLIFVAILSLTVESLGLFHVLSYLIGIIGGGK